MARKFLIAAGTARYDNLPDDRQLPTLTATVDAIVALFTGKLGYERVLQGISTDPISQEFRITLDDWLGSSERDNSDWIVFYYTGHGELLGTDSLYFLTKDYVNGQLVGTAFSVSQLIEMLISKDAAGENRRVRRFLAILDTCHAGAGALDLSHKIGRLFSEGFNAGMFYVLAAAFPKEEALAGGLANALIEALEDESLGGSQQTVIFFDQLVPAINRRLRAHKVVYSPMVSPDEEPQFFPNPRHLEGLPQSPTVADIRRAVALGDLQTFWGPTSRGVEMEMQPGWYFTGRERVRVHLAEWLRDPKDDRTRIITGRPGSGKSAILAKIVTLSDTESRRSTPEQYTRWGEDFPLECIHLAIHAKGKTFQEVMGRLASSLEVEAGQSRVLAALKSRQQPYRIIVDALDEAREPERIARHLLEPLNSIPGVKLLVGTRPEYSEKLGNDAVRLHVDDPKYFEKDDLTEYVAARLLGRGGKDVKTPYQGKEALVEEVAKAVAEKAYPNFLIARLVAEDLLATRKALDRSAIQAQLFPHTVAKAFEQFLSRFRDKKQKAVDLLTPLAWPEGLGLPWGSIWPALASALSGRPYDNEDIHWVMEHAGSFIVEALEQDRSVYRLYHQALADYLRQVAEEKETQQIISSALIETVPAFPGTEDERDWREAHPYVRTHLAEHAAACGMLGDLVGDPLFLLSADPGRLLSVVDSHPNDVSPEIEHIYKGAVHNLRDKPIAEAASYLEMTARKIQFDDFADRIQRLPLSMEWSVPWASWVPIATHRILTSDAGPANALLATELQGRTAIVCGGGDGSIRVWDLEDGRALGKPLTGHSYGVVSLAIVRQDGRTIVVAGSHDDKIRIWDLEKGELLAKPLTGHTDSVTALAIADVEGRAVIVSGSDDGTIRIWDLEKGRAIGKRLVGHKASITALVVTKLKGRAVIVSGSHDDTIRIWDLADRKLLGRPLTDHTDSVSCLAVGTQQGRTVIVSGSDDESIRIWDLELRQAVGRPLTGNTYGVVSLAIAKQHERTVIVAGCHDDTIRIWDLEKGRMLGKPRAGHTDSVISLAIAKQHGRDAIVSGSDDESIRIWDLEEDRPLSMAHSGHRASVTALTNAEVQGRAVIVSGSDDNSIRVWDLEKGGAVGKPFMGHTDSVISLAMARRDGRDVVVSGSDDKSVRVWDLGKQRALIKTRAGLGDAVRALVIPEFQERSLVVCGSDDGNIRVWDVERARAVGKLVHGHMDSVKALVVTETRGRRVIVSGSDDKTIRIWDLQKTSARGRTLRGHKDYVTALAVTKLRGRTVIISGSEDKTIRIWDLETGRARAKPLTDHTDGVTALVVAELPGRTVIVSGSYDNFIRVWDLWTLTVLQTIDIGAPILSLLFAWPLTVVVGTSMGLICIRLHRLQEKNK